MSSDETPVQPPSVRDSYPDAYPEMWDDTNTWNKLGSKRGVETIFRTSYNTHVELTAIADRKANIMISVNGIIISVLLATVIPRVQGQFWLTAAVAVLLLTCIIALTFALLSALPRVSDLSITPREVRRNKGSTLFFGRFITMTRDEYEDAMVDLLHNRQLLYRNMVRDLHGMGLVLEKKYRMLRVAYIAFLVGMMVSIGLALPSLFLSTP